MTSKKPSLLSLALTLLHIGVAPASPVTTLFRTKTPPNAEPAIFEKSFAPKLSSRRVTWFVPYNYVLALVSKTWETAICWSWSGLIWADEFYIRWLSSWSMASSRSGWFSMYSLTSSELRFWIEFRFVLMMLTKSSASPWQIRVPFSNMVYVKARSSR